METFFVFALNGLSYGLLLFMLSSGLTLIFSMMGVLNFAHTSFYMLGAYFAYALTGSIGFFPALIVAPLLVGALGAAFERYCVRKVHPYGHVPELLVTFGLSYVVSMGQWLTIPFIILGLWLVLTAASRRQRVEPVAGNSSVA